MIEGIMLDKEFLFVFGIPIWLIVRGLILFLRKRKNVKNNIKKEILLNAFALYIFLLIGVTLFPIGIYWGDNIVNYDSLPINYIPIRSIIRQFSDLGNGLFSFKFQIYLLMRNIGGNIMLLVPLSIFLPMLWDKYRSFKSTILFCIVLSFSIEILQLLENIFHIGLGRISDIDDLLLNTVGAILGFKFYSIVIYFLHLRKIEQKI